MEKHLENLEKRNSEHEAEIYQKLSTLRTELNDDAKGFVQLASKDIEHEYRVGQELFLSWVDESGSYKFPPHKFAALLSNHALRFEKRSNYYGLSVAIFGVASAIFSTNISQHGAEVALLTVVTFVSLIMKWNIDKHIVKVKQMATHLLSFPPTNPYEAEISPNSALQGTLQKAARP